MKLNSAQLGKHLQGNLSPVYVVSGDEPLLCQEATDAIRAATRQQGFSERQVFNADNNFDWGNLLQAGASLSLFADKRLLELRLPNGKPGDKGAAALLEYLARPAEDTVLLISLPKLDGSTQKTKWAKALIDNPASQFVQIWPVEAGQLPQWIRQRLAQAGLSASQEAVELIAEHGGEEGEDHRQGGAAGGVAEQDEEVTGEDGEVEAADDEGVIGAGAAVVFGPGLFQTGAFAGEDGLHHDGFVGVVLVERF